MFSIMLLCCMTVKGWFPNTCWRTKDIFYDIRIECENDFEGLLKKVFKKLNDFSWWKQNVNFFPLQLFVRRLNTASFHFYFTYLLHWKTTMDRRHCLLLCSSYARSMGCENICNVLVEIVSIHSFRLANMAGVGRRIGALFIERRIENESDFIVKLRVNCSRKVDISLHNSLGRFIDLKLSVCASFLLSFEGFVTQKWLQWDSKPHESANFSDRIVIPKTLMVRGMENLLPLKFWRKST